MCEADNPETLHQDAVSQVLAEVLESWQTMKRSEMEDAGEDADRFQTKFYVLMDAVRQWIRVMARRPEDVMAAQSDERFAFVFRSLPSELQIPFELELESALSDTDYTVDDTEQG